jgi:hypothetical protein
MFTSTIINGMDDLFAAEAHKHNRGIIPMRFVDQEETVGEYTDR